jgi:SAM-dependent methyltransferase
MTLFNEYAKYYDALYKEKDYGSECSFLEAIFTKYANQSVRSILDLGCGTGGHIFELARRGYTVCGVDQSAEMLSIAQEKKTKLAGNEKITFQQGDIRNVQLNKQFDAAVSMFAVIGYMVSNDDLQLALKTARQHLHKGGLFIFDAWYGPAVLSERPIDRYKIIELPNERIIRFAHPEIDVMLHTVEVQYQILRIKGDKILDEVNETHTMRFFFPQEISYHLECAGFQVLSLSPFLRIGETPNEHDWNFSIVAEASLNAMSVNTLD